MRGNRRDRGNAVIVALLGLIGAVLAAMISRGCFDRGGSVEATSSPSEVIAAPAPAPSPVPDPVATPAPASAREPETLSVFNPCDQPLLIALSALETSGRRMSHGFYQIDPSAMVKIRTDYTYIFLTGKPLYYYTKTSEGAEVESGDRPEVIGGSQVPMKRAEAELETGDAKVLNLRCPG